MDTTAELKIAAVVLTLNRLDELKGCLAALHEQTRSPDEIIVVEHGSTDGTREWLEAQGGIVLLCQENRGPGAGFARGMREAVARGADWVWCLDDDAHPARTALAELRRAMHARPGARVLNSIGIARNDPTQFALGALWVRTDPNDYLTGKRVATLAGLEPYTDANGIVDSFGGHFYQGLLLHRAVIEHVGMPYDWFVIQGEEVEYGLRIMRAGYHILAVTSSIVLHPALPAVSVRFFGKTRSFRPFNARKRYYSTRNGIRVRRMYYAEPPLPYALRRLAGAWLTDLWLTPNLSRRERMGLARSAWQGVLDGLRAALPDEEQGYMRVRRDFFRI